MEQVGKVNQTDEGYVALVMVFMEERVTVRWHNNHSARRKGGEKDGDSNMRGTAPADPKGG